MEVNTNGGLRYVDGEPDYQMTVTLSETGTFETQEEMETWRDKTEEKLKGFEKSPQRIGALKAQITKQKNQVEDLKAQLKKPKSKSPKKDK